MAEQNNRLTMEEIITLIQEERYQEADFFLDVPTVKKAKPKAASEMLLELIPLRIQAAKAMTDRVLAYGRFEIEQKDEYGYTLIRKAVEKERTDVLNVLAEKLKTSELKKKDIKNDRVILLEYLLDHQQKLAAAGLLKKGILRYIDGEDRTKLIRKILKYKDESMLREVLKCQKKLMPETFPLPGNASERQFMCLVLEKYAKSIDLDNARAYLWEVAFSCGAAEIMCLLLKKKEDYQYLTRIAQGPDEIFQVLDSVRPRKILEEIRKEVLISALLGFNGKERFAYLAKGGWSKGEGRRKRISILDDVRERIKRKRYDSSRRGQKEKEEDQNKLNYLIRYEKGVSCKENHA